MSNIKRMKDKDGNYIYPVTHVNAVYDSDGNNLLELLPGPTGPQGEQGPKGDKGDKGEAGYTPIKGVDYFTTADKEEMLSEYATKTDLNEKVTKESGKSLIENELIEKLETLENYDDTEIRNEIENIEFVDTIRVNGEEYTQQDGVITLPDYSTGGGGGTDHTADIEEMKATLRRQNILIEGLMAENADKRTTLEENTPLSMDFSVANGFVAINTIQGETLLNVANQNEAVVTKAIDSVSGNRLPISETATYRPVITGKSMEIETLCDNLVLTPTQWNYGIGTIKDHGMRLQTNHVYTIVVDITNSTLKSSTSSAMISLIQGSNTATVFESIVNYDISSYSNQIYSTGRSVLKGVTKSSFENLSGSILCTLHDPSVWSGSANISVRLLDGDYTATPELIPTIFEDGLQSSFQDKAILEGNEQGKYEIQYISRHKNLFKGDYINGGFTSPAYDTDYYIVKINVDYRCYYVECKPNTSYYILANNYLGNRFGVGCSNQLLTDKEFNVVKLGGSIKPGAVGASFLVTTSFDAKYLLVYVANNGEFTDYPELLICESNEATEYEPYEEPITKTLYLNTPLLEDDTIEEIDGKIYHVHRSYKEVITADKIASTNSASYTKETSTAVLTNKPPYLIDLLVNIKCNILPTYHANDAIWQTSKRDYGISTVSDAWGVAIRLPHTITGLSLSSTNEEILNAFKQWVTNNHLEVIYLLKKPIYELISEEPLFIEGYAGGYIELDTIVPVKEIKCIGAAVNTVSLNHQASYKIQFISDIATNINILCKDTVLYSGAINKGLNKIQVTTPALANISYDLTFDGDCTISNISIVETIQDIDYFKDIQSACQECLTENGKYELKVLVSSSPIEFGKGGRL